MLMRSSLVASIFGDIITLQEEPRWRGLGFRVQGLGFGGLGFRVWGLGLGSIGGLAVDKAQDLRHVFLLGAWGFEGLGRLRVARA